MNILITGGAGFVGSNLCIALKIKYPQYNIIALDNLRRRGSELNINRLKDVNVTFIHGDIRNVEDLSDIKDINVVIDASADPSVLSGITSSVMPVINSNLVGTLNLLEFASNCRASFVFLSTSRVYPVKALEALNYTEEETRFTWTDQQTVPGVSSHGVSEYFPLEGSRSFYGCSKLASELLIAEYVEHKGLKAVINRCGVLSGPWQMGKVDQGVLVLWLARHFFKGRLNYIGYNGKGKQLRDVLHINDLVDLVDLQLHSMDSFSGHTFNVGGGKDVSCSLLELTQLCSSITGNKIEVTSVEENRPADLRIYISDCSKIHNFCNWRPKRNLGDLLIDTHRWIVENETRLKTILH